MATSLKGQTNGLDLIQLELRGILWPWISWLRYVVHRTCHSLLSSTSKLPCLKWSIWTWKFIDWDWMGSWSKWGCILSGTLKSETFFTPEILFVSEALWRLCLLAICFAEQLPDDECSSETCGLELHQLRAQKEESKLVVKKDDDHIASNTSFTGSCSADDETLMNKFGGGNADGTFPKIIANCGHSAYSFWSGFNKGKMASCIASQTGLSSGCAGCFASSGQYGYDHCKIQCLFGSWCSNLCLSCSEGGNKDLNQCVGVPTPSVSKCWLPQVSSLSFVSHNDEKGHWDTAFRAERKKAIQRVVCISHLAELSMQNATAMF